MYHESSTLYLGLRGLQVIFLMSRTHQQKLHSACVNASTCKQQSGNMGLTFPKAPVTWDEQRSGKEHQGFDGWDTFHDVSSAVISFKIRIFYPCFLPVDQTSTSWTFWLERQVCLARFDNKISLKHPTIRKKHGLYGPKTQTQELNTQQVEWQNV